jgi:hypothetical protein
MGRHVKFGLDYFLFDPCLFQDVKMRKLLRTFGSDGPLTYLFILCDIYKKCYFVEYSDDYVFDLADRINISYQRLNKIIKKMVDFELFEKEIFVQNKVFTSQIIQLRYLAGKEKMDKKILLQMPYRLVDINNILDLKGQCTGIQEIKNDDNFIVSESMPVVSETMPVVPETTGIDSETMPIKEKNRKEQIRREKNRKEQNSKNGANCACERDREKIRIEIFDLLKDKEWCRAACSFASEPSEYEKVLPEKLQNFYDYIVATGAEDSIDTDENRRRRFFNWQKYYDKSVNKSLTQDSKEKEVPRATKLSKNEEMRLMAAKAVENLTRGMDDESMYNL